MKKRILISKKPKTTTKRAGDISLYYFAYVKTSTISDQVNSYNEKGEPVIDKDLHITFNIKAVEASKIDSVKEQDVLNSSNGVFTEGENEHYQIDLEAVPLPTMNISSFENSLQMQDWLNIYYLQMALNEGKDFSIDNWVEKEF